MARDHGQREPAPTEEIVRDAFVKFVPAMAQLVEPLGEEHQEGINQFVTSVASNGAIVFFGSERFFGDMERAGKNATKPPFGLEVTTLSDDMQLVLYPRMIYKPGEDVKETAEEVGTELRVDEPQAMIYVLDGFAGSFGDTLNHTANLIFIGSMVNGLLEGRYPVEDDSKSKEFEDVVYIALDSVRKFAAALTPEQRTQLSGRVAQVAGLSDGELVPFAVEYAVFQAEEIKMPGLREPGNLFMQSDELGERPKDAVVVAKEYLRLTARNLPEIQEDAAILSPWKGYGTHKFNRDYQLFGRYEVPTSEGQLRVDFRLDSTHMPASYGFFDTIEVTRVVDGQIKEQIILGQEIDRGKEALVGMLMFTDPKRADQVMQDEQVVFPVIISGNFDFTQPEARELLESLTKNDGAYRDVRRPIADAIRFSDEGRLTRLIDPELN